MTYQVIARKWRPQTFTQVVGQDHITATLTNALATDRIAHCYLFCGPRGVGKTTTARILAKALNCRSRQGHDPCQRCTSCVSITNGTSMDVLEIDGASNNSVDDVRELREVVRYVPTEGSYKIYIIDEVHMLSAAAFNALLKTLEEPPDRVVFVFATTEVQDVPDTILSRCQRFNFRRISAGSIAEHLQMIAEADGISTDQEALYLLAQRADGALRDAESMLDQLASFDSTGVTSDGVRQVLGLVDHSVYFNLTNSLVSGDSACVLDIIAFAADEGNDFEEFIKGFSQHLGQLLSVRVHGSASKLEVADTEKASFETLSKEICEEDILRMLKIVLDLETELRRSVQPRFRIEMTLVRLARMGSSLQVGELLKQVQALNVERPKQIPMVASPSADDRTGDSVPVSQGEKPNDNVVVDKAFYSTASNIDAEPESDESKQGKELQLIKAHWDAVINQVKREQPPVGNFLSEGELASVDGSVVKLMFSPESGFQMNQVMKNRAAIEQTVQSLTGQLFQIKCESKSLQTVPPAEDAQKEKNTDQAAVDSSDNVKLVLDTFDGELM